VEPSFDDVLYIGRKTSNNAGNDRLRALVRDMMELYDASTSLEKKRIVDRVINEIRKSGGRFLKQTNDDGRSAWEEESMETVRTRTAQQFRNLKRRQEAASRRKNNKTPMVGTCIAGEPRRHDVILGRNAKSGGNDLLQRLIKDRSKEYDALDRGTKRTLVDELVREIKERGGRFLQPVGPDGGWLEISDESAKDRVSKRFRNHRRQFQKKA